MRMLLGGDMEPEAQQPLDRSLPGLRVDVLKVPHHGSRYQDPDLLERPRGARGGGLGRAENDYGHPAAATVALLRRAGMSVERTDEDGDVALTVRDGRLAVRTRGGLLAPVSGARPRPPSPGPARRRSAPRTSRARR